MNSLVSILAQACAAAERKAYAEAIAFLEQIDAETNLSAEYFRLKSRFIQLSDSSRYSLKDAEICLLRALKIDSRNPKVLVDLGYFYSRVVLDEEKSKEYFLKAIDELRCNYAMAVVGLAEQMADQPQTADKMIEGELEKLRRDIASKL